MPASGRIELSARLSAPPAAVWALVRRFGEVADWNPFLAESRIVNGRDGKEGAEREVTTKDGATARERLVELDDDRRTLDYRMVTFPIPVVAHRNRIVVSDGGREGAATVVFSAGFEPAPGTAPDVIADINRTAFATAASGLGARLGVAVETD